jgi:hypothetical protein
MSGAVKRGQFIALVGGVAMRYLAVVHESAF